jgi:hypothetical protein
MEFSMAKSPNTKTNGHTVAALKPAAPKKPAVKAAAAKSAPKSAVKPAPKAPVKPAVKAAPKAAVTAAVKPAVKKAAVKPAAKTAAAKPAPAAVKSVARKSAAPKPAPVPATAAVEMPKERKAKLVRDSFTMPEQEYAVLGQVKKACIKAGFEIKKSELLRIGVALISQLDMATLQQVLASLPQLKTGRPKNV